MFMCHRGGSMNTRHVGLFTRTFYPNHHCIACPPQTHAHPHAISLILMNITSNLTLIFRLHTTMLALLYFMGCISIASASHLASHLASIPPRHSFCCVTFNMPSHHLLIPKTAPMRCTSPQHVIPPDQFITKRHEAKMHQRSMCCVPMTDQDIQKREIGIDWIVFSRFQCD